MPHASIHDTKGENHPKKSEKAYTFRKISLYHVLPVG